MEEGAEGYYEKDDEIDGRSFVVAADAVDAVDAVDDAFVDVVHAMMEAEWREEGPAGNCCCY